MLSKSQKKDIQALSKKKYRDETGLFVAEGEKLVNELLTSQIHVVQIFAQLDCVIPKEYKSITNHVSEADMKQISQLKTPSPVLALAQIPSHQFTAQQAQNELILALDGIQDPGNLGTIIRLADWFGIRTVICSLNTVDLFNFKVVMSSMGAITRVKAYYIPLKGILQEISALQAPIYGTFLEGKAIQHTSLRNTGVVVMGNEGKGISPEIAAMVNYPIHIPSYPSDSNSCESLNVATATAIVLHEFRRGQV